MADQAERVILEAEDQVTPVVGQGQRRPGQLRKESGIVARQGHPHHRPDPVLDPAAHRIARKAGRDLRQERRRPLISQRDQLLQRYAKEPQAIDAITKSYEKMIAIEEKAAREAALPRLPRKQKPCGAIRTIKSFGDRVGQFMQNPLRERRAR
jgi:hypothetical protein